MEINTQIIKGRILKQNLRRILILPLISIPINIGHILFFYFSLPENNTPEYDWHLGIIALHFVLILIGLSMLGMSYARSRFSRPNDKITWVFVHIITMLFILTGILITLIDQIVTPAITPLLIALVAVAVVFLIHPRNTAIMFILAYCAFFFLLPITQTSPDIVLSNRVNALTAIGLAYVISLIIWKQNWSALRQNLIIDSQQQALEESNEELRVYSEQLKELNATKDKLFSIIAHDLRNPFNNIIGLSDIMKDELENLEQHEIKSFAAHINNSASQTLQLLDNLLDWAKMQQGKKTFSPSKQNLHSLADEVMFSISDFAERKNIQMLNHIPEYTWLIVDADMLKTILRNLLSNAVKFTKPGGTIRASATESDIETIISVSDNGIGISDENIKKLFHSSTNFTIRGTENETGTGLGLVLCKDFIDKHRGRIWVESEEDKGSVFSFSIPKSQ